jgi:uncharacterized protein
MKQKEDRYSPNMVIATLSVAVLCLIVMCGQTLWVPASRIENLYVRSVVLAAADSGSAFAAWTGLDGGFPAFRNAFLDMSGLSRNISWDTRFYNTRDRRNTAAQGASGVTGTSAADNAADKDFSASASVASSAGSPIASPTASPTEPAVSSATGLSPDIASIPPVVESAGNTVQAAQRPQIGVRRPNRGASLIFSAKNPLNVFVFGDSQVFSLGSGLSRLSGKDSPMSVDFLPIHSSGFIRGDYFNWPAKLDETFRDGSYEAAVMMLGMNDYQSFWDERGRILKKHTPEWEAAYKAKCRELIDITLVSVPRLYWLGMPKVKNQAYDESLAYIDSVQRSLAEEYSPDMVIRVSLRDTIPGAQKPYADSVDIAPGKKLRVMSDDGSHFTVEGGQLAMKPLFDRLCADYLFSEVPVAHLPE